MELYEWQEKCMERWFANRCRGIAQAATGAGKTRLALAALERLKKQRGSQELLVRIVVPNGGLMRQWERALRAFLQETEGDSERGRGEIGLRGDGRKDPPSHAYMIYVINSARYELARQIMAELKDGKAVFLIADECHHYGSGENCLIFEFLPHISQQEERFFSLGLSATLPHGREKAYLESVLGRQIYNYGIAQAARQKAVCRYDIYHICVDFREEEREEYQELSDRIAISYGKLLRRCPQLGGLGKGDRFELIRRLAGDKSRRIRELAGGYLMLAYKRKSLVCMAKERISCAYELVERLGEGEKILVFGERISQAEELYRLLRERFPGRVARYHSKMGRQANKNALERFCSGELRILLSCKAMDEGVDVPDVSVGIILSGTSMQRQRIQRLGRIVRNAEGKDRATLYYLHIEESSEDRCYLQDTEESGIFEMSYRQKDGGFAHPAYDRAAEALRERLRGQGADERLMEEAERCLRLGAVRPDWRREEEWLKEKARQAGNAREKNYWVCMRRLLM